MIEPGTPPFYVVVIGRSFIRFPESAVIGRQLEHAHRFPSVDEARAEVRWLKAELTNEKKPITIQRVTVEAVE